MMRPKKGRELWNTEHSYVIFYEDEEGLPVASFENLWEIVDYKGLERTKKNKDAVATSLYRALRGTGYTSMLTGKQLYVCLVDIDDDEDEEDD